MDLSRMKNDDKLYLCKWYFKVFCIIDWLILMHVNLNLPFCTYLLGSTQLRQTVTFINLIIPRCCLVTVWRVFINWRVEISSISFTGFLFLPLVWFVNTAWFFEEAFRKPPYEEQKDIKKYVTYSGIGATIWIIVIAVWVYTYQTHRAAWGEWGDQISFIIPTGMK